VETAQMHSVIPMLFTPVPGSALYEEYRGYLFDEMGFDLQSKQPTMIRTMSVSISGFGRFQAKQRMAPAMYSLNPM